MNTNPSAIKVLCYGDSNTYARERTEQVRQRYAPNSRWTGVVQSELGDVFMSSKKGWVVEP